MWAIVPNVDGLIFVTYVLVRTRPDIVSTNKKLGDILTVSWSWLRSFERPVQMPLKLFTRSARYEGEKTPLSLLLNVRFILKADITPTAVAAGTAVTTGCDCVKSISRGMTGHLLHDCCYGISLTLTQVAVMAVHTFACMDLLFRMLLTMRPITSYN